MTNILSILDEVLSQMFPILVLAAFLLMWLFCEEYEETKNNK